MTLNKDMKTMAFKTVILFSAVAAFAASDSSRVNQSTDLLAKLDSMNASILGLRLSGTAEAGILSSTVDSDQQDSYSPERETQGYTHANLILTARPSSETEVRVELRLHQEWQSAYEDGINPVIGHWFSYDGLILNKTTKFNLGYMRVGYTPLTIYTPQVNIIQEPEIFTERRVETLAERNLDTSSTRLLQGLNADYHSGKLGVISDLHMQATGARMRNAAKKSDEVFFDFDWSDRYLVAGRLGVSAFGADLGVNYTNVFDRRKSTRSLAVDRLGQDTIVYEDNQVLSFQLGFNSKELFSSPVEFGLNTELAMSFWQCEMDYVAYVYSEDYRLTQGVIVDESGALDTLVYVQKYQSGENQFVSEDVAESDGIAINVQPYVSFSKGDIFARVDGLWMQNDEEFWSELASSPTYWENSSILNTGATYSSVDTDLLDQFRSGSLENLYFSVYNTNVLNQSNLMSSSTSNVLESDRTESSYTSSRLYNNYKLGHFYRNGYDATTYKRLEATEAAAFMDPSVNMALPFGLATPDRNGFSFKLNLSWKDMVEVNGLFGQYNQDEEDNKYTQYGGGLGINLAPLFSMVKPLTIQGSFEQTSEDAYYERKVSRLVGGFEVGLSNRISLLGGYEMVTKKYGTLFTVGSVTVDKVEETLFLIGPKVKISPASYLTLQYGILGNKISYTTETQEEELAINKSLLIADVTVQF